jgi:hypothetical protein
MGAREARMALAKSMSERDYQEAIVEAARVCGWRVYHTHDSRHSPAGFPDLVLVRPPQLLFVELKSARGVVSADQRDWIADLRHSTTVKAGIFWPQDEDELLELLRSRAWAE